MRFFNTAGPVHGRLSRRRGTILGSFLPLAEQGLNFPLKAKVLGDVVEVVDLDGASSNLRCGIVALARKGEREHRVALAGLELVEPDPVSAEWLAVYRYWLELR